MRIVILFNAVSDDAPAFERDVLTQVNAVDGALRELGHETIHLPCTLNLDSLRQALNRAAPELAFNLVEALGGSDRLIALVPALLETLRIPFTGTGSLGLISSTHKIFAKQLLRQTGCPTPDWLTASAALSSVNNAESFDSGTLQPPALMKAVFEHGSFGMDDSAVVLDPAADVGKLLSSHAERLGCECFAERYIDGRELNLSLLSRDDGSVEVLPPAEIKFIGFAEGKPRIVGDAAKWAEESSEFIGTPRTFDFDQSDATLLDHLAELARKCWRLFDLGGYARVDFRVDEQGAPWILEVNANPCLSPDAGFAAALNRAAIPFTEAVQRIVNHAQRNAPRRAKSELDSADIRADNRDGAHEMSDAPARHLTASAAALSTAPPPCSNIEIRREVRSEDSEAVRRIVSSTGFFYPAEVDVAVELIDDRIAKGARSDYHFLFAERAGETVGYACYGAIACTMASHDLYWIAVDSQAQRGGVGRTLLAATEQEIGKLGPGQQVYIETSNRPQYQPTREFYERCGYVVEGVFKNFYGPGDDKVVYVRRL